MDADGRQDAPKVFISYSHDSLEHRARVWQFAERLRADGLDAVIDQYAPSPEEGFPRWMENQIERADFVLLVCTEIYCSRVRGKSAPGTGHGVLWEATITYQHIYDAGTRNKKFIPVLFDGGTPDYIPKPLKAFAHYRVDAPDGYEGLYRRITLQPGSSVPPLGNLKALPTAAPGQEARETTPELQEAISSLGLELFLASNTQQKDAQRIDSLRQELLTKERQLLASELSRKISGLFQEYLAARSLSDLETCSAKADALLIDHPNSADLRVLKKQILQAIQGERALQSYRESAEPRRAHRLPRYGARLSGLLGLLALILALFLIRPKALQTIVERGVDILAPLPPPPPPPAAPKPPEIPPGPVRNINLLISPLQPRPNQSYTVVAQAVPPVVGVRVTVSVVGTDGYRREETGLTDASGRFVVQVPGARRGVVDTVTSQSASVNGRTSVVF